MMKDYLTVTHNKTSENLRQKQQMTMSIENKQNPNNRMIKPTLKTTNRRFKFPLIKMPHCRTTPSNYTYTRKLPESIRSQEHSLQTTKTQLNNRRTVFTYGCIYILWYLFAICADEWNSGFWSENRIEPSSFRVEGDHKAGESPLNPIFGGEGNSGMVI